MENSMMRSYEVRSSTRLVRSNECRKLFDSSLKTHALCVPRRLPSIVSTSESRMARSAASLLNSGADQAEQVFDGKNFSGISRLRRRPHAYRHLFSTGRRPGLGKQGSGDGGRYLQPELHPHLARIDLNRGGPYREFMPEVFFKQSNGRFWSTTAIISPRSRPLTSTKWNVDLDDGITSFKIFMFYGGYGLHGRSTQQNDFLIIGQDEQYDHRAFRVHYAVRAASDD